MKCSKCKALISVVAYLTGTCGPCDGYVWTNIHSIMFSLRHAMTHFYQCDMMDQLRSGVIESMELHREA